MLDANDVAAIVDGLNGREKQLLRVFDLGAHRDDRPEYFVAQGEVTNGRNLGDATYNGLVEKGLMERGIASRHGRGDGFRFTTLGKIVARELWDDA